MSDSPNRMGHFMATYSGKLFFHEDPRPGDVCIQDIAHSLSMICRFGGHVRQFYSVGQHSVLACWLCCYLGGTIAEAKQALLHDGAEAYMGDVIWPLKHARQMTGYGALIADVERVVAQAFGTPAAMSPIVKYIDMVLLATEKRDVVGFTINGKEADKISAPELKGSKWEHEAVQALPRKIWPWTPERAEVEFLKTFEWVSRSLGPDETPMTRMGDVGLPWA